MKPTLLVVLILVASRASAQAVEPTCGRAIRSVVQELVSELPYRVPNGEALAVIAEPGASAGIVDSLLAALSGAGFRVQQGAPAGFGGVVPLHVAATDGTSIGSLRVRVGDLTVERGFGRASWVDPGGRDPKSIVVVGSPRESVDATMRSAREKLADELSNRFPALAAETQFARHAASAPVTTFVATRFENGRPLYEAYLLATPRLDRLARAERTVRSAERRAPWIKASTVGVVACVLWFLYVRADFRSRGYRTRRLRIAFGTLFVVLSLSLWSLPL